MASNLIADSLQPSSDGLQPSSDVLHPSSDGLQPNSDGLQPNSDGLQPNSGVHRKLVRDGTSLVAMSSTLAMGVLQPNSR